MEDERKGGGGGSLPWCALAIGKGSPIFQKRYKYIANPIVVIISVFSRKNPKKKSI